MTKQDFNIIGSTGLVKYGGYIYEEWLNKLQGERGVRFYKEMRDNSPIVGAFNLLVDTYTREVEWRTEPANDTPDAVEQAEFVDSCFEDMEGTFDELLSEIVSEVTFGWAYFNDVKKVRQGPSGKTPSAYDDGRVGWRTISLRSQETLLRWEYDDDDRLVGMVQQDPNTNEEVLIPADQALHFRIRPHKNNPEGRSMYRNAARPYMFVRRLEEIEAIGIERDLAGYPIMEVPPEILAKNATSEAASLRTDLERLVQNIKRDEREGALIPSELDFEGKPTGFKLRLLTAGGSRTININESIKRHETRIAMSLLAEFIMLGMDKVGSFSLASSKTNVFAVSLGALLESIAAIFNRVAIPRLMMANNVARDLWPKLVHGDIETPPLNELGAFLVQMSQAGMDTTEPALQRKVRELGNLPQPDDPDAVTGGAPMAAS